MYGANDKAVDILTRTGFLQETPVLAAGENDHSASS